MPRASKHHAQPSEPSTPWFPIALACLFVAGCVVDAQRHRKNLSLQVDPDSDLWSPAVKAAKTWSQATGRQITVSADGEISVFRGSLPAECEPDDTTQACSWVDPDPTNSYTVVREDIPNEALYGLLLHEFGHHLRGLAPGPRHLDDPTAVMHDMGHVEVLTPKDIAFICASFDCAPSPTSH